MSADLNWRLRRAGADDAAALSLIANAAFLDTYVASLDGTDLVAHCLRNNTREIFETWTRDPVTVVTIAEVAPGHAPIGYAVLTAPDFPIDPVPGDVELRRIYTMQQAHGSGIGAALMTRALQDAAAMGGKRMLLGVWEHNKRARAFYERSGFTVIGSRQFQVGSEIHDDPIYARSL